MKINDTRCNSVSLSTNCGRIALSICGNDFEVSSLLTFEQFAKLIEGFKKETFPAPSSNIANGESNAVLKAAQPCAAPEKTCAVRCNNRPNPPHFIGGGKGLV